MSRYNPWRSLTTGKNQSLFTMKSIKMVSLRIFSVFHLPPKIHIYFSVNTMEKSLILSDIILDFKDFIARYGNSHTTFKKSGFTLAQFSDRGYVTP